MDANTPKAATLYQKRYRWNRTWKRITTVLASVVVFITTYALILPAITMEPAYICGKEAHVHTDACYQLAEPAQMSNLICTFDTLGIHTHTTECYNENSELMCGYADFVLHTHSNHCYNQNGELSCVLPEIEAHIHDERCWKQPHAHADTCYIQQRGELLCTVEEGSVHTHLDTCYTPQQNLICTVPETAPHTHITDTCYTETRDLLCTEPEVAAHTHSDTCYTAVQTLTCTMEELEGHSHSDACYDENGTLICGLPEIVGHKHDDACYQSTATFSCTLEESAGHTHIDTCYSTPVSTLTCTTEETEGHTHGTECFETVGVVTCAFEENVPHSHTDACFLCTPVLQCTELTAEEGAAPVLSCQEEERMPHIHDASCLDESGAYICGKPELYEHIHEDVCFVETVGSSGELVLICGCDAHEHTEECIPEEEDPTATTLPDEEALIDGLYCGCAEHTHQDGCFNAESTLMCTMSEHQHNWICALIPSDFSAVETSDDWEADLPELQGDLAADLIAVAESQLGYEQSEINYIIENDEQLFYSRYGAWWDEEDPYGEWNAKFVSFCLEYAGVEEFPQNCRCSSWVATLQKQERYSPASEYIPSAGDIVFFNWDADASAEHVGIVAEYFPEDDRDTARIRCIEGNSGNAVRYTTYNFSDPSILGYGQLPLEKPAAPSEEENIPEETETEDSFDAIANVVTAQATGNVRLRSMSYAAPRLTTYSDISAQATGTIDMTGLIETVTVYKKLNGGWVEVNSGDTITDGEDLKFTIDYIVPGEALSPEKNTLVYQIPKNIKNVANSSGSVYNDAKKEVGTYVIDAASNTISITFFDTYVAENQLNKPIVGSISFKATVEKITQDGNESQEILFSDKVKIEMEVAEKEEVIGDVKVEKSVLKVEGTTITYQIKVSSTNGTFAPVILTDKMTGGIRYKDGLTVKDRYNRTVEYTLDPSSTNTEFAITLPQMAKGQVYTITYNAALSGIIQSHTPVGNKAAASSKDSQNLDISDFAEVDYTFKFLDKVGKLQEDGSIKWTIVINEEKKDISGAVLRDIITEPDGSQADFTGSVTITDSRGNSSQITLPYTFPSGSKDTYTVTYTTTHDQVAGESKVTNLVGLAYGPNNDWFIDDEEVIIGESNPLAKEGKFLGADPETGKFLNQWTITVDTSGGSLPTTAYLRDSTYDTQYMTYAQLQAAFDAINKAVAPFGATISNKLAIIYGTYTEVWNDDIDAAGDSNVYNQFYVQFSKEIPKGQKISFTYTTSADAPPDSGLYYNQVSLNDKVIEGAFTNHVFDQPVITKVGVSVTQRPDGSQLYDFLDADQEVTYEELAKVNGKNTLWWRLRLLVPEGEPVVVKDILPEGMELVGVIGQIWSSWDEGDYKIMYPDKNGYAETAWFSSATSPGYRFSFQTTTDANGRQTVTFDVDDMAFFIGYYDTYLDLYVVAKFRDDFQWGNSDSVIVQVPFANKATIESPDGKVFDTDDHTFVVTYDQSHEVVSKAGALTELNELEYEVKLNVEGRDLDPAKDTIRVTDVLTYDSPAACPIRLYLKPGTVNVYDYTGGVKGALIASAKYTYTEDASGTGDISYTHTLDLVLPDQQPMLLEYVYTVDGEPNDYYSYDMVNTCTIIGIAEGSIDSEYQLEVKVNDSAAQANVKGVSIYKVNADSNGLYLPGAVFNVYTWSSQSQQYVRVKHPNTSGTEEAHYAFTTDKDGCLMLNDATMEAIAYNTAYYITEITPPSGYFNDPTPYYFYIAHADTNKNPMNLPWNFEGDALQTGALIYYENEPVTTEITIYKKWQDHNGNPVQAAPTSSVRFELWQKLEGTANSDKLYGTYAIEAANNWAITITGLPKGIVNPTDGTKGASYLYYIKEVPVPGYEVSYEYDDENNATSTDSGGINSGTINMTNRKQQGYELPETGGAGITAYRLLGGGMMLMPIPILWRKRKMRPRGRGADGS